MKQACHETKMSSVTANKL